MNSAPATDSKRRRSAPLLWAGGAIAALILVLGVSGTLSSWTSAIITNDDNTAGAADAVALSESDGTFTCNTVTDADNEVICSTINKYGGDTTMLPGDSNDVDVTFTNTGNGDGTSFGYGFAACVPTNGPGNVNLCTDGDLTVGVQCVSGATFTGTPIADLTNAPVAPGSLDDKTLTGAPAMASGDQITCRFTTTLIAGAKVASASSAVAQEITFTLSA